MKRNNLLGTAILTFVALVWGLAFVAQRYASAGIGTFTFNCTRLYIGALALLPIILVNHARSARRDTAEKTPLFDRKVLTGGALCGIFLLIACVLQQRGIETSGSAKAAFITALYIIFVPLSGIFFKRKVRPVIWVSVAAATVGLYLLTMNSGFTLRAGDIYLFGGALFFTCQILVTDKFAPSVDCIKLSFVQFVTAAVLATPFMIILEHPTREVLAQNIIPILYAGLISCGVGYTLQSVAQKFTDITLASLAMSLESVFAAIGGFLILNERLSAREIVGCAIIFAAVIAAQLPSPRKKRG